MGALSFVAEAAAAFVGEWVSTRTGPLERVWRFLGFSSVALDTPLRFGGIGKESLKFVLLGLALTMSKVRWSRAVTGHAFKSQPL